MKNISVLVKSAENHVRLAILIFSISLEISLDLEKNDCSRISGPIDIATIKEGGQT